MPAHGEFDWIAAIARVLGAGKSADVELSIGDDAAILAPIDEAIVVTNDASVEGVHFRREWLSLEDVGYRATIAATSDVLAMGARPVALVAAWTLPPGTTQGDVEAIARGQRAACDALGTVIVGGNIADGPGISITTTAIGRAAKPIRRAGARPGDRLVICGAVGEAGLGVQALLAGTRSRAAIEAWRRPPALVEASRRLARVAHAMIDVSDGLAQDVGHVAEASGVAIVIDVAAVRARRRAILAAEATTLGLADRMEHLELAGGEDYALVAAIPRDADVPEGADVIGFVEAGQGVSVLRDGAREAAPEGFRHG